jgi:hypothetical protein
MNSSNKLYVVIGGAGSGNGTHAYKAGGYNGGGNANCDNDSHTIQASGGGATHIATSSGVLSSLKDNTNAVLIVAGGGGGGGRNSVIMGCTGGYGGGTSGGNSSEYNENNYYMGYVTGATQSSSGSFVGSNMTWISGSFGQGANQVASGGGGGWYGGAAITYAGSGGSGYIGGVANGSTTGNVQSGNGRALITWHPKV